MSHEVFHSLPQHVRQHQPSWSLGSWSVTECCATPLESINEGPDQRERPLTMLTSGRHRPKAASE